MFYSSFREQNIKFYQTEQYLQNQFQSNDFRFIAVLLLCRFHFHKPKTTRYYISPILRFPISFRKIYCYLLIHDNTKRKPVVNWFLRKYIDCWVLPLSNQSAIFCVWPHRTTQRFWKQSKLDIHRITKVLNRWKFTVLRKQCKTKTPKTYA